jgi:hypothetical protein
VLDIQRRSISSAPTTEASLEAPAAKALAAVIEAGARILVAEPWRAARIVPGAGEMTIDELAGHLARRRRARPTDFNRAIAFAQLSLALKAPQFRGAWAKFSAAPPSSKGEAAPFRLPATAL